ncbi:MAG: hypothetical protein JO108_16820 [Acidobacteriaceae bacterium]|nr:hypothetical protein [Acidobacteriaceae bacterium]
MSPNGSECWLAQYVVGVIWMCIRGRDRRRAQEDCMGIWEFMKHPVMKHSLVVNAQRETADPGHL